MSILRTAALNVYNRRLADYEKLALREALDKQEAFRDKSHLPDHHWQAAHTAKLKLNTSAAILASIIEIEGDAIS
jgi:hypothetical protein